MISRPIEPQALLVVASTSSQHRPEEPGKQGGGRVLLCRIAQDSKLVVEAQLPGVSQPLFTLVHPDGGTIYIADVADGGTIHTVDILSRRIRSFPSGGQAPCHLTISEDRSMLLCANYSGSSLSVHRLRAGGQLGHRTALVELDGVEPLDAGAVAARPHHLEFARGGDGRELFVTDLGRDVILRFSLERDGTLHMMKGGLTDVGNGPARGPRSLTWDASGHLWCAEERSSTVSRIHRHNDGLLHRTHTWPASSIARDGLNYPGQIVSSADGRFVYVANRGSDTITAYNAERDDPRPVDEFWCGGRWPASLIQQNGVLLVANRDSNEVSALLIDPKRGTLSAPRAVLSVRRPSSIAVVPVV